MKIRNQVGVGLVLLSGCLGQGKSIELGQREPERPLIFQEIGKFKRETAYLDHYRGPRGEFLVLDPIGDLVQEAPLYQDFRVENPNSIPVQIRVNYFVSPRLRILTEFFYQEFDFNRTSGFAQRFEYSEATLEPSFQLRVTTPESESTREKVEVIPLSSDSRGPTIELPAQASAVFEVVFRLSPRVKMKDFYNCIGLFDSRSWMLSIHAWKGRFSVNRDVCLSDARCLSRGENLGLTLKQIAYLGTGRDLEPELWREELTPFVFGSDTLFRQKAQIGPNPPNNGMCPFALANVTDLGGL